MENQRNTILAIVLSLLVLLVWNFVYLEPQMEAQRQAAEQAAAERAEGVSVDDFAAEFGTGQAPNTGADPVPGLDGGTPPAPTIGAGDAVPGAIEDRATALAAAPRVPIETDALSGSINLRGARLDDLILKRYRQTVDENSPPVELLSPGTVADGYFVELGFAGENVPDGNTVWTGPEVPLLAEDAPIVLTWDNGAGLLFQRIIELDANYLFTVTDRVTNGGGEPVSLTPYGRTTRFQKPTTPQVFVLHEGLIGFLGEDGLQEIDYGDIEDDRRLTYDRVPAGWLGITDKYWATALIPDPASGGTFLPAFAYYDDGGTTRYQASYARDPITVPAGGSVETVSRIYAGAKVSSIIDEVGDAYAIPQFDLMIDWGWFYFITRPMFWLIDNIYQVVGNFGVAILLATIVVKLIFFPLANKSYASMAKMKMVQPKMQEIKEKHPDDRQAQQRAMMELYKTEKINPVAGCWPVLLQIPVFFALYKVLYVTIEMRHAPFFGWIQDLSAPDPTSIFNLFGLLPFGVPGFLLIGVWPLIMGITMFLQMRMNPMPPDPTQKMIFTWMPVIFTFMLATFPAGLVIYWAWNNFLSILQQGVIMRKNGAKIELWDNLKALFSRKKAPDPAE